VGLVINAVNQEGSEKLIKLTVDFAEETPRIIFTAVRPYGYTPEYFLGKKWIFVTNLEPKKIMGEESQGMILAVDGTDDKPVFLVTHDDVAIGAKVR
jgi:methionine--tRNA ligase beta chain